MPRALESRTYSTKLLFVKTILLPLVNIYTAYPSIPSASAQAARGMVVSSHIYTPTYEV